MQNKILIVIGPKGAGKTQQVSTIIDDIDRVAIFDMVRDAKYANKTQVIVGRPAEFARAIVPESFKVTYHPVIIEPLDNGLVYSPEFGPLLDLCHKRGDMYFVIDEAHLWCNSRNCPKELMMANLIGRHKRFSMIFVAQSFAGIHPAIRKNADEFMFWKLIEPSDLDGIKQRCGAEVMEQVRNLRAVEKDDDDNFVAAGQMLHWSKSKGVVCVTD